MTFTKPIIGPKVYLSRGPSGHAETFRREVIDEALRVLLGKVPVKTALDGFIGKKERDRTPISWPDIIIYLGALIGMPPDKLPIGECVAFWAQADLAVEAEKRAKEMQGN